MAMKPTIEILDHCTACGACEEICPVLCLRVHNGMLEIVNEEVCFGCRKCEDVCPEEAIHIKGIVP
jgi:NAD-dependent dihydropyrimidine dehydrogenase PreA subunit